ncbi:LacI family DNA-binding transcriptional regulator [Winogradskya consettensis]|uniref:LacI family transcriptional regulator n=1 Tax=Winogradskya consettensis TaxID=113560 RepID=A0A919SET9_9ACTN|nr:LacI family transcriptional regulator [Actinoplanes consettensis]
MAPVNGHVTVNGSLHPVLPGRQPGSDYDAGIVKDKAEDETGAGGAARRVTLRDVAKLAGVSHQTVSRAINDKGEIDPETRRRVLEAAKELRYRPSRFARGLVRPGAVTVGLIVPDVVNPFFPELIAGVIDAAQARGWQIVVASSQDDTSREPDLLRGLAGQVDAMIGYLFQTDDVITAAIEGVPLVVMNRRPAETIFAAVDLDVAPGVHAAVDHLVAQGHRRIGMLDCPPACDPARRSGFLAAMAAHDLPADAIVDVEQSMTGGETGLETLHAAHPGLTAVFAFNDLIALGAYRAIRRLGLDIPADLALVGFDGLTVGEILDPPLTTVHIDKRRMGELAVAQAQHLLDGTQPGPVFLETRLLVRGSA